MPRKKPTNVRTARSRGASGRRGGSSAMKYIMIGGGIVATGIVVWLIVKFLIKDTKAYRDSLDKYVELTDEPFAQLKEGAGVYVDMSDGMNFAYANPEDQNVLKAVINQLAAMKGVNFYGLAEDKVTPLEYNHTNLYNYMVNAANYDKQRAPIEASIDSIVAKDQPALLMTDFEEYNGGVIQKAAYAKRGFIEWLSKGYNITFYKWNFEEQGKQKHMYLAVFDNNYNRLNGLVAQAIGGVPHNNIELFVVGSKDFYFPMFSSYQNSARGGNYHDSNGVDLVTAIPDANGNGDFSYHSYFSLVADATGKGKFMPLSSSEGYPAEYYPLGVSWQDALKNANNLKNAPGKDRFQHLLSGLYVDFEAQSGYDIEGVEVRVFDIQNTLESMKDIKKDDSGREKLRNMNDKELTQFLTAGMHEVDVDGVEYDEITVDFHPDFKGTVNGLGSPTNLVRANIVISKTKLELEKINEFFSWADNNSLAESVKFALQSPACDFAGRVIFSYYLVNSNFK